MTTVLVLACGIVAGCGSKNRPYPVSGSVYFGSQPIAEAVVTFHPRPGQPPGHPISAITDSAGRFQITLKTANDGLPVGEYAVTIVLREKRRDGDEEVRNGRNLLHPRYAEPESSGLTAVVKPYPNTLEPFVLTE